MHLLCKKCTPTLKDGVHKICTYFETFLFLIITELFTESRTCAYVRVRAGGRAEKNREKRKERTMTENEEKQIVEMAKGE